MRMRRIPWSADYLTTSPSRVHAPEQNKGNWNSSKNGKLHLEIGCGKGGYSTVMAALYPQDTFVAVERNESAAGLAAKKFDEAGVSNLSLVYGDGADLSQWFAPGELDIIHLNFSDPWPKKRNAKRRLSAPGFLEQYKTVLADNGQVIMKTDNQALFEYSLPVFAHAGFMLEEVSVDFRREDHPEDPLTEYEEKFVQAGNPIYRAIWQKG